MAQPRKHARDHLPSGYAVLVEPIAGSELYEGADPMPAKVNTPGGGTPAEWMEYNSTTNWGTSLTLLDFVISDGSSDLVTPTFGLNVSTSNPTINKAGSYEFFLYLISITNDGSGTVWTHVSVEWDKVSGPSASGPHGWENGAAYTWLKTTYWPNQPISGNEGDPHLHTFAHWDEGDFVGTPFEYSISAVKYFDGIETAETVVQARLLAIRIGDPY